MPPQGPPPPQGQPQAPPGAFGPPPSGQAPSGYGPPPGQSFGGPELGSPPRDEPGERNWGPAHLPWDTPAGEASQDSAGSSWQPPGSRHADIGQPSFSDDELDLDDRRKRRLPLVIGGVVVVLALLVAGYFAWPLIKPGGSDEPKADPPATPAPASVAAVEEALNAKGYECYDALDEPVAVRSCYPTKDAAVSMSVRMQADGKSVAAAQLYAPLQGVERGPALKAFDDMSKSLAGDILGGKDASLMPTASDGETVKAEGAKWGSAAVDVTAGLAVTEFIRSGAEVAEPEAAKLPLSVAQMNGKLSKAGFTCQPTLCEKTLGEKGEKHSVGASFGPTTMRVAFRPRTDKKPHDPDAVEQSISDVIGTVLSAPEREKVLAWIDSNRAKQPREADFAGVHVNLQWGDGAEPALTMSTPIAWG